MIYKIDDLEFQKYLSTPMRLMGETEQSSEINIRKYILEILKEEKIKISLDEIEIPYVYEDSNKKFEHILLSFGIEDSHIVIVNNRKKIIGYHILNLNEKYN